MEELWRSLLGQSAVQLAHSLFAALDCFAGQAEEGCWAGQTPGPLAAHSLTLPHGSMFATCRPPGRHAGRGGPGLAGALGRQLFCSLLTCLT